MKHSFIILFLLINTVLLAFPLQTNIITAIKNGNSNELAKFMDNSIELTIPGNEGAYSKAQSELILKNFFIKNQPTAFKVMHQGDSKNNTHYTIGKLATAKGDFRVYILYKETANVTTIVELRIETDE